MDPRVAEMIAAQAEAERLADERITALAEQIAEAVAECPHVLRWGDDNRGWLHVTIDQAIDRRMGWSG